MSQSQFMFNRRNFLASLGAFSIGSAFGIDLAPKTAFKGEVKGRRVKLAAIGCGGMGGAATISLLAVGCDLVAVCDINPEAFDQWEKRYPGVPKFTDYREMLKTMGDKFEAVEVGTPDHTHAYISVDCMLAGKHVYVQKPLARTVEECELMLKTQLKTGVVCQMGNQGHPGVWRYKAMRDAAVWGDVKELYSWSNRPVWPQGMKAYPAAQPLPANYAKNAWDCWCGPSADHGFNTAYHSFNWRGWWDYGCGAIGDMAVHNADPAFWTFELGLPITVKADTYGEGPVTIAYPKKSRIEMTFAPNKWIPNGIKLTWLDGGLLPEKDKIAGLAADVPDNGLIVVGSKATTIGQSHAVRPTCIAGDAAAVEAALQKGDAPSDYNHYREFVEAVLDNDPARCGSKLAYAAPLTEALLIGCIALRFPGEELHFDPKTMQFTNKPEANRWLRAPKRGDWDFAKMTAGR